MNIMPQMENGSRAKTCAVTSRKLAALLMSYSSTNIGELFLGSIVWRLTEVGIKLLHHYERHPER